MRSIYLLNVISAESFHLEFGNKFTTVQYCIGSPSQYSEKKNRKGNRTRDYNEEIK